MWSSRRTAAIGFAIVLALFAWAVIAPVALAQCGGHGGGHDHGSAAGGSHAGHSSHEYHAMGGDLPPTQAVLAPHGGVILSSGPNNMEIVYLPQEMRVYLYGESMNPLSTRELNAQATLDSSNRGDSRAIVLEHVPQSADTSDQDYLAAAIDMAQVPDQTPIRFRFEKLPDRRHPKAEFTPLFSPSEIRPYVARVSFVQADRKGIEAQRTCPVTGALLGSMGKPVKVLVGERPLYLCCRGCIEKVKEASPVPAGN